MRPAPGADAPGSAFAPTVAAVLLAAAVLSGCGAPSTGGDTAARTKAPARTASALVDIARFEDLQVRFAQDIARPRLVLLLSPT